MHALLTEYRPTPSALKSVSRPHRFPPPLLCVQNPTPVGLKVATRGIVVDSSLYLRVLCELDDRRMHRYRLINKT
jgi:hypothetical protein